MNLTLEGLGRAGRDLKDYSVQSPHIRTGRWTELNFLGKSHTAIKQQSQDPKTWEDVTLMLQKTLCKCDEV